MNPKQYLVTGLMVGSILGALICAGIVVAVAHQPVPQPTPQIAATSTSNVFQATPPPTLLAAATTSSIEITVPLNVVSSSPTCLVEQNGTCVVATKDLIADITLLKAIRSGNFAISGHNISIPTGNGSSTDLMNVLNYMQGEIGK
jgi:hypothetical protein